MELSVVVVQEIMQSSCAIYLTCLTQMSNSTICFLAPTPKFSMSGLLPGPDLREVPDIASFLMGRPIISFPPLIEIREENGGAKIIHENIFKSICANKPVPITFTNGHFLGRPTAKRSKGEIFSWVYFGPNFLKAQFWKKKQVKRPSVAYRNFPKGTH